MTRAADRTARELFDLKSRVEAGFEDVAERLTALHAALDAVAARAAAAESRAEALERAAAADRLALAGVLDPLDDLLALLRPTADPAVVAQFERLAAAQLTTLAAAGLDEIPAAGAAFDPRLHDGVGARPGGTPGAVLDVVRRGFRWRGAVLRRAQVVIAE